MLRFKAPTGRHKNLPTLWLPRVTTAAPKTLLSSQFAIPKKNSHDTLNMSKLCQQLGNLQIRPAKKNMLTAYQQSRSFVTSAKVPSKESFSIGKKIPQFDVFDDQGNQFNIHDILKTSFLFAPNTIVVFQPGLVIPSLRKFMPTISACTLHIHDYAELNDHFARLGYNLLVLIADKKQFNLIEEPLLPIFVLTPESIKKMAALGRPCFEFDGSKYPLQFTCFTDQNFQLTELHEFKSPQDVFLSLIWQNWKPSLGL